MIKLNLRISDMYKNFSSLKQRLLLLTILAPTIMVIISGVSYFALNTISTELRDLQENRIPLIQTSSEMTTYINSLLRISVKISQSEVDGLSREEFQHAKKIFNQIQELKIAYKKLNKSSQEELLFKSVEENWTSLESIYITLFEQVEKLDLKDKNQTQLFISRIGNVLGLLVSSFDTISDAFQQIDKNRNNEMDKILQKNNDASIRLNKISILFGVFGISISIFLGIFIGYKTKQSMNSVSNELVEESFMLTVASKKVVNSSDMMAEIGTSLATALEEITSQFKEINNLVEQNNSAVVESEQLAKINQNSTRDGDAAVEQLIISIQDIEKNNNNFSDELKIIIEKIKGMTSIINNIGAKSKVIDDIVFQTKLLSFNASVEASRAGNAGKGFSVVADEIGKLAKISGEAAREISELLETSTTTISQIINESQDAVDGLCKVSKIKISNGSEVAKDCRHAFSTIATNISQLEQVIGKISLTSKDQSQGIKDVASAVKDISKILNKNRELAGTSTDIAEDLNQQAESLETIVQKLLFILNGIDTKINSRG